MASLSRSYHYQPDLIESQVLFLLLGLRPGSLGDALLLQDLDLSIARAHPNLKRRDENGKYFIIEDMMELTNILIPEYVRTDMKTIVAWERQDGLRGVSLEDREQILNDLVDDPMIDDVIERTIGLFY